MAYKKRGLVKPGVEAEFTIGRTAEVRQRNGVSAIRTEAVHDEGGIRRDVVIFANGRRVPMVRPSLVPGAKVRLSGKFSQRNTFVALGMPAQG